MCKLNLKLLVLVLLNITLIGCNNNKSEVIEDVFETVNIEDIISIDERRWTLVSYQYDTGDPIAALDDVPFNFSFVFNNMGDRIGFIGFDGCNAFSSEGILVQENIVTPVNGVPFDDGLCENLNFEEYISQAAILTAVITDTFSFEETESLLVLRSLIGQTLTFVPCIFVDPNNFTSFCEPI